MFFKQDQSQHKIKVAFFDRDGTINFDYEDHEWATITNPIIIPHALEALRHVADLGYEIIIITNQYLIGEGIITLEQYNFFSNKLIDELERNDIKIKDVFFCPHSRNCDCNCSKPKPGMIYQAMGKYPEINLHESIVIGDSKCDVDLAESVGIKSFGIGFNGQAPSCTYINSIGELITTLKK